MYSAPSAYSNSSFSSSPPSSPGAYVDSSSPASSPSSYDLQVLEDDIPHLLLARDPFSAAKVNWKPPQYEKKRPQLSTAPPSTVKKPRYNKPLDVQSSPTNSTLRMHPGPSEPTQFQIETDIWETAGEQVVDEGNGRVSLEDQNLTRIPESFIQVLSNFFTSSERSESDYISPMLQTHPAPAITRPLNRATTEPVGMDMWGRPILRTKSVASVPIGLPKNKIQLFLSCNRISILPLSLFRSDNLKHLTVLSLRNNNLTHVPPEIVNLNSLEELSIGQNRIRFLPAELLQMTLKALYAIPNPFLDPPPSSYHRSLGSSTVSRRKLLANNPRRLQVSRTEQLFGKVPSLAELLLRVLLSPAITATPKSETLLEEYYDLPLPECPPSPSVQQSASGRIMFPSVLSPLTRKTLDCCLPGSVYLEEDPDSPSAVPRYSPDSTGVGWCPSPKHQRLGTPRLFVQHAEERYTWETVVAGVEMGGSVPMRWRGCQLGCLDFLDPLDDMPSALVLPDVEMIDEGVSLSGGNDDNMDGVVQMLQLSVAGPVGLEFDDE